MAIEYRIYPLAIRGVSKYVPNPGLLDTTSLIFFINTSLGGDAQSTTFTLPTFGSGYLYDVDWDNKGVWSDTNLTGPITHDFLTPGPRIIRIRGSFPRIYFYHSIDGSKLTRVSQWGSIPFSSMASAFRDCDNLVQVDSPSPPNLSSVSDMSYMFTSCVSLVFLDISLFDTSTVSNMVYMFYKCTSLSSLNISSFDTSNVISMYRMFSNCSSLTSLDVSNFDTSNVTTMYNMFSSCSLLDVDVSSFSIISLDVASAMMANSSFGDSNYDLMLVSWESQGTSGVTFNAGSAKYGSGAPAVAKSDLLSRGWSITDGGAA
jgi:surface protein